MQEIKPTPFRMFDGTVLAALLAIAAGVAGCGDDLAPSDGADPDEEAATGSTTDDVPAPQDSGPTPDDSGGGTDSGGSDGADGGGETGGAEDSGGDTDGGGSTGDAPHEACEGEPEPARFIWIPEGPTLVKMSTVTMDIMGRYAFPTSSATAKQISVGLNGDVAVAVGDAGVMMIHGDLDDCPDPANTSQGDADVRPFPDGCVGWVGAQHVGDMSTTAWTTGKFDTDTCRFEDAKVWAADSATPMRVMLLDGDSGETLDKTEVALSTAPTGRRQVAVDREGNLWASAERELVRIDPELVAKVYPGEIPRETRIVIDDLDRPVLCGGEAVVFDPIDGTWYPQNAFFSDCALDELGAAFAYEPYEQQVLRFEPGLAVGGPVAELPGQTLDVDHARRVWAIAPGSNGGVYRIDLLANTIEQAPLQAPSHAVGDLTGVALRRMLD